VEDVLSASQARLTGILDIAEDGIISMDQDHRINLFLSLPLKTLDSLAIKKRIDEIGTQ